MSSVDRFGENAQLALDIINRKPRGRIPSWLIHPMEWRAIDALAGVPEGTYQENPGETYWNMQRRIGTCMIDQMLAENPLTMGSHGYESGTVRKATTGAEEVLLDGIRIDSPEAVVAHLESVVIPDIRRAIAGFDGEETARDFVEKEQRSQKILGADILKAPYSCAAFPRPRYSQYGYENYLMTYALYPEVMETVFSAEADYGVLHNAAIAKAIETANIPRYIRLDMDMADGRSTLVDIESLDRIWFPHFARAIAPLNSPFPPSKVRMIWHCDGNLSQMVPRLLEAGISGFQGFQYEHNMDYESICRTKSHDGEDLLIIGGVSVTTTLPYGTPADVRSELRRLVEHGPRESLFLGCSSSITPGVPIENLRALVEGLAYYRKCGIRGIR